MTSEIYEEFQEDTYDGRQQPLKKIFIGVFAGISEGSSQGILGGALGSIFEKISKISKHFLEDFLEKFGRRNSEERLKFLKESPLLFIGFW